MEHDALESGDWFVDFYSCHCRLMHKLTYRVRESAAIASRFPSGYITFFSFDFILSYHIVILFGY